MDTLKDVYLDQLQDLYSATNQAAKVTERLAAAAANAELRAALDAGVKGIRDGKAELAKLIRAHDAEPGDEFCKGMEGLVKEAKAHALDLDTDSDAVRDASIITQYQRMAHYAIAGYGTALAFAKQLGLTKDAKALQPMLDSAYSGDRHMSAIAEGKVNAKAA